jgi:glycosyltransferase involved in cell wall biosynthesis
MRIDLHVHSRYSEPSAEWFMERFNVAESYSDPFFIYDKAMKAGMSKVTITDHNRFEGSLILKERYGEKVLTGMEATAHFPEDGCKVHILVYGIDEKEAAEIQVLRKDIYELRAYIREKNLAHSVAHATYSVQPGKLTVGHLEKLIVLFNVFEVINGGRNRTDNAAWRHILEHLTPGHLEALCRKHALDPFDSEPWRKGFTAGSDDHGGLFIGQTFTEGRSPTAEDFLDSVREKKTSVGGRYSDYQTLAFSVYKVMHDFSRQKDRGAKSSLLGQLADSLFEGKRMGLANRLRMRRLKAKARKDENGAMASFRDLVESLEKGRGASQEEAIRLVYSAIAGASDRFLRLLFDALSQDLGKLDLYTMVRNVQASVPGVLLLMPFFLTLRHLSQNRVLVDRLASLLGVEKARGGRKILWFTDTLKDLNGVSVTLQEIGSLAHQRGLDLKIVTSIEPDALSDMPPNVLNLPFIHQFNLPYYESYNLKIPSVLASLKEIYRFEPDTIHISTPGPVGLLGLLTAKLMNIRSVGFYHTDFAMQAQEIVEDDAVAGILESYTRWFYSSMDEIRVPTLGYITMLRARGFDPDKMRRFTRGIDSALFRPQAARGTSFPAEVLDGRGKITLLYVGRVSRDKGVDLLIEAYEKIAAGRKALSLLIVGDGPYLSELKRKSAGNGVRFAGRMDHGDLPAIYAASSLFVFPSATDTFGKAVLEAQACGLPAIVSDAGGPREIIVPGKTGFVARAGDASDWSEKIGHVLDMISEAPQLYRKMREDARAHVIAHYDWEDTPDSIFEPFVTPRAGAEKKIA